MEHLKVMREAYGGAIDSEDLMTRFDAYLSRRYLHIAVNGAFAR